MASLDWAEICDDIVSALNGASYAGEIVITNQAVRGYLPKFDDRSLGELQVVVAPADIDLKFETRKRRRTMDGLSVAVHIVSPNNTIDVDEIDKYFILAGEVIDIISAKDTKFGGRSMIAAGLTPTFDPDVFEKHLAVWVTPVFAFK